MLRCSVKHNVLRCSVQYMEGTRDADGGADLRFDRAEMAKVELMMGWVTMARKSNARLL